MNREIYPSALYTFLKFMRENSGGKRILDCGAGGHFPKISLFYANDYEVYGIEIIDEQITKANEYAKKKGINLNIQQGDMRSIPFESEYFDYVYSYNTIFHMSKKDIGIAIDEIYRILKNGGLCYLNLLSCDDSIYGEGEEKHPGEFSQMFGDEEVIHTFFKDDEPDNYFDKFKILYKQKRTVLINTEDYLESMLDYIVKKDA